MLKKMVTKVIGTRFERELKRIQPIIDAIKEHEQWLAGVSDSEVQAQTFANYLLDYYKDPLHEIRGVEFYANTNATLMEAARDLELLQKVDLTESQTGLSSQGLFIYAIRHTIAPGRIHKVSLDLEQPYAISGDPFIIEESLIDGADVIIY